LFDAAYIARNQNQTHQDSIGRGIQDVLDDADGGELHLAEVADEGGGDEADGELKDLRQERREGKAQEQPRLLPAPAHQHLHRKGIQAMWMCGFLRLMLLQPPAAASTRRCHGLVVLPAMQASARSLSLHFAAGT